MNEYISIKEFAAKVGVSKQAVYRRIEKDLKQYVKVENGTKSISTEALPLFYDKPVNCSVENSLKLENKGKAEDSGLVQECFRYTFQVMREQIEIKDRQLAEKDRQLAEKDKQLQNIYELKQPKNWFSRWFKKR